MIKRWCEGLFLCLAVLFLLLACLLHGAWQMGRRQELYAGMSRQAVAKALGTRLEDSVTRYIGLDADGQTAMAAEISDFMQGRGELPQALNEKEKGHMQDVRALLDSCEQWARRLIWLAAVFALGLAWLLSGDSSLGPGLWRGLLLMALLAAGTLLCLRMKGFDALFYRMHELLFDNDNWLLDPRTDVLIRMMPEGLFEKALFEIVKSAACQAGVLLALLAGLTLYMRGRIRKWTAR